MSSHTIASLAEAFALQVQSVARAQLRDELASVLNGQGVPRSRLTATARAPRSRSRARTAEPADGALLAHIKRNPGQRGEQITKALRMSPSAMRWAMKKLIADKAVKTKGQRRGMTYSAR